MKPTTNKPSSLRLSVRKDMEAIVAKLSTPEVQQMAISDVEALIKKELEPILDKLRQAYAARCASTEHNMAMAP